MPRKSELKKNVHEVRRHSRQLVREWDAVNGVYLDTEYTLTECHVMFELSTHSSLTLMSLANNLLLDKSNASRTVKHLIELGVVRSTKGALDKRSKNFSLTAAGKKALQSIISLADDQVEDAMLNLSPEQRKTVIDGLRLYGEALGKGRRQASFKIRKIRKRDNSHIANVIRVVMTEFGAVGDGYSIGDAEVDDMFGSYGHDKKSFYYVIVNSENRVLGGGGIGPLIGGPKSTCELRKMFFLSELRGLGMGRRLLLRLLDEAQQCGYSACYLETLERMDSAVSLYVSSGFERLESPMGNTGHCRCDSYFKLNL